MSREADELPEPDRYHGAPHPRERGVLFGHEEAEMAFVESLRSGRLHHAWLLGGPEGIGKATLAYRVARYLLAHGGAAPPGGRFDLAPDHPVSRQVAARSHPDLAVIRRGLQKTGKAYSAEIAVDQVRRALDLFASTASGGYRVCIVDCADDLNASSANALLKVVEEPPPRSLFLIISHAPQRLLPTIRSRCRRLALRPLSQMALREVVQSLGDPWSDAAESTLQGAVELGEGSARRTLDMLDKAKLALVGEVRGALDALPRVDTRRVLALAERTLRKEGEETLALLLASVQAWASERLRERAADGPARLAPLVEVCDKAARQAREIDAFNLDRRPLVLALFDDLADVVRRTA